MCSSLLERVATPHRANVDDGLADRRCLPRRLQTFVVFEARLSGVSADRLPP